MLTTISTAFTATRAFLAPAAPYLFGAAIGGGVVATAAYGVPAARSLLAKRKAATETAQPTLTAAAKAA